MLIEKRHYDAFNYWFSLTQEGYKIGQAIELTAEEFGVVDRTVRKWYDEMGWKEMGEKRMLEIQRMVEKKENRTFAQNQKKYLDILHRLLYEYVEDGLPAKIESIRDLEVVIKNSLLLQDRPTENIQQKTEHTGEVEIKQPLFDKNKMEAIIEREREARQKKENK